MTSTATVKLLLRWTNKSPLPKIGKHSPCWQGYVTSFSKSHHLIMKFSRVAALNWLPRIHTWSTQPLLTRSYIIFSLSKSLVSLVSMSLVSINILSASICRQIVWVCLSILWGWRFSVFKGYRKRPGKWKRLVIIKLVLTL